MKDPEESWLIEMVEEFPNIYRLKYTVLRVKRENLEKIWWKNDERMWWKLMLVVFKLSLVGC